MPVRVRSKPILEQVPIAVVEKILLAQKKLDLAKKTANGKSPRAQALRKEL